MITDQFDTALAAIVTPLATGFNVYTGKSSEEKALPCVICSSELEGEEDPQGTGNFWIRATVEIKQTSVQNEDGSNAGATGPKTAALASTSAIIAGIMDTGLAASLTSGATGLHVFNGSIMFTDMQSGQDETGIWVDLLSFKAYVCGADLT